jgi:hypothetical protein
MMALLCKKDEPALHCSGNTINDALSPNETSRLGRQRGWAGMSDAGLTPASLPDICDVQLAVIYNLSVSILFISGAFHLLRVRISRFQAL